LLGTNLQGADLRGALLGGADLTRADLTVVRIDENTEWPAGFDLLAHCNRQRDQDGPNAAE
jgi:uncharacterized protein YjbI with pentapeptide repeats